jgi:murein DD-endopeptidase MepM/ murein hydrolase activator NlpD
MNSPVNKPRITGEYGTVNSIWPKGHGGLDIVSTTRDLNIHAACDAKVIDVVSASAGSSYGHYIKVQAISDPNVTIIYAHLVANSAKVKKGDTIYLSQVIGTMGATGNVTGVHLHFEVRENNVHVNPCNYLGVPNKEGISNMSIGIPGNYSKDENDNTPVPKQSDSGTYKAGDKVDLDNKDIFISATSVNPIRKISGEYYLYDGINTNGKYRICPVGCVGRLPIARNVTGWVEL